jgi:hypothetical protein
VTVFLYNIFCIYVTYLLSSIWHAILENFRPVSVWGTDLILYYLITDGLFGEAWTKYSWIQFIGMILLFVGTAVYNGSIEVPGFEYEGLVEEDLDGEVGGHHQPSIRVSELSMASPNITRSPIISRVRKHTVKTISRLVFFSQRWLTTSLCFRSGSFHSHFFFF